MLEQNEQILKNYLSYLRDVLVASDNTIASYNFDITDFLTFIDNTKLADINIQIVKNFLQAKQDKIATSTTARIISSLNNFFKYLLRQNKITHNPLSNFKRPKKNIQLVEYLSEKEVDKLLDAPDNNSFLGIRDKAMFELLYSCGLRVSELVNLTMSQIDLDQQTVLISGKGGKQRLLPIGISSIKYISNYLTIRRKKSKASNNSPFFLSNRNKQMTRQNFWLIIKNYVKKINSNKKISPHTLRHAFATHLVKAGADLRAVQIFLGHSDISTTQIYTQIHNQTLKKLHQKHHPKG